MRKRIVNEADLFLLLDSMRSGWASAPVQDATRRLREAPLADLGAMDSIGSIRSDLERLRSQLRQALVMYDDLALRLREGIAAATRNLAELNQDLNQTRHEVLDLLGVEGDNPNAQEKERQRQSLT